MTTRKRADIRQTAGLGLQDVDRCARGYLEDLVEAVPDCRPVLQPDDEGDDQQGRREGEGIPGREAEPERHDGSTGVAVTPRRPCRPCRPRAVRAGPPGLPARRT